MCIKFSGILDQMIGKIK